MYGIEYNGLTITNTDVNFIISKIDGISRVPSRVSEDPLTGGHGGNIWEVRHDMRPILIGGYIIADDFTTYYQKRNELLSAFRINSSDNTFTITKPDGTSKSIQAKVIDIPTMPESEGEIFESTFEFMLKAEDPYWLSTTTTSYTCGLAPSGGTPVPSPLASPIGSLSGNTIIITNSGDVAGQVTFQLENSMVNPVVYNLSQSTYFAVAQTLVDGDVVQVYKNNTGEYCLKNGVSIYSSFSGTAFDIPIGVNIIQLGAETFSATALLTITFTEKFITF